MNELVFEREYPARGKQAYSKQVELRRGVPQGRNEQGDEMVRLQVGSYRSTGAVWLTKAEARELGIRLQGAGA